MFINYRKFIRSGASMLIGQVCLYKVILIERFYCSTKRQKESRVKCEDSEECNHEYQDNQESNVGRIMITRLNAKVLGF